MTPGESGSSANERIIVASSLSMASKDLQNMKKGRNRGDMGLAVVIEKRPSQMDKVQQNQNSSLPS